MWGTIVPRKDLEKIVEEHKDGFTDFTPVATLYFRSGDAEVMNVYAQKFGLPVYELSDGVIVALKGSGATYQISYDGVVSQRPVDVMPTKHVIRGSARWQWSDQDEGLWIFCPAGCCGDDGFGQATANLKASGSR
jgi:hypothetical protein